MRFYHYILLPCLIIITGCSSSGSVAQTKTATNIVQHIDISKVKTVKIANLHASFLNSRDASPHHETVIEIKGDVVAFSLTEDNLYTVTLREGESDAICYFNNSISDEIGTGMKIHRGATLTVRGQCFTSGLFSSKPFTLDGCSIVD